MNFPVHLKNFNLSQLRQLCKELRSDIVHTVSKTGGTSPMTSPPAALIISIASRSACLHVATLLPFTHFCLCEPSVQVIWGHLSVWWN